MFTTNSFPNFFRVVPSENALNAPRVALLEHFNWTRVGTIYQNEPRYALVKRILKEYSRVPAALKPNERKKERGGKFIKFKLISYIQLRGPIEVGWLFFVANVIKIDNFDCRPYGERTDGPGKSSVRNKKKTREIL